MKSWAVVALAAAVIVSAPSPAAAAHPAEVFRVDPLVDGAIVAGAGLANLVPWLLEDRIIDLRCPCDEGEVNPLDRWAIGLHSDAAAHASQATLFLALLAPPLADWAVLGGSRAFLQDLTVFAETLAVSGALTTLAKYTSQRPIPRAYEGQPAYLREPGSYRAFWSGHTSATVAALTDAAWTIRLRYGERRWPWLVAAVGGASVGVERVWGGHHFPTDVVVGFVAGAAVGTAVPLLHARGGPARLALAPLGGGLALVGRF
ncbi:phosphatase PAP2 family protein [Anaeromyxobacter sp. Fw109-5]|uniref:phosphatase PAP2 family protein n=1 Tax=Anaeromyxobacter sp. (strain Fw109-5) TaxID=404589 RepID=UPI000158A763|nr:phosphatase PAP2 family protein [Anaeromyxobacter sp. Fw109-5]ABS26924.1 phosphoesterase PA-phosphatase related [Anaeromyxobacter sp. Fw109-5]